MASFAPPDYSAPRCGTPPVSATPGQLTFNSGTLLTSASFTLDPNRGIALTGAATISTSAATTLTSGGIIAGASTETLRTALNHAALVRAMPNTPAQIGVGMNIWYATPETTESHREQARALLGALGREIQVDDERFVAMATAVSGTGPTYVFLVMEALIDSAVHLGFPRHLAHDLVMETLKGSVAFAEQSGKHPAQLRDMVTSPGGTSAAALHELERGRLRTVLADAVWAAYRRTISLSDSLSAGKNPEPMPPRST